MNQKIHHLTNLQFSDAENQENVDQAAQVAEEEEEKVLTLEQYLATKKPVSVQLTASARKANEGADDAQWKNTMVLNKTQEDFIHLAKEQEAATKSSSKTKQTKQFLAIEQRFSDEEKEKSFQSTRGGRGGRGGERGRGGDRGRGTRGGRGGRGQSSYDSEFPSLGA